MKSIEKDQVLVHSQIAAARTQKGGEISCHEFGPGFVGIRQSGLAPERPSGTYKTSQDIHFNRTKTASEMWKALVTASVPPQVTLADQRVAERAERLKAWMKISRTSLLPNGQEQRYSARPKTGRWRNADQVPLLLKSRPVSETCPNDGFWHSWECDAMWFQENFCRYDYDDVWCLTNYRWVVDEIWGADYVDVVAVNAALDGPSIPLWSRIAEDENTFDVTLSWRDDIDPRHWVRWTYFTSGQYYKAQLGYDASHRVHYFGGVKWQPSVPDVPDDVGPWTQPQWLSRITTLNCPYIWWEGAFSRPFVTYRILTIKNEELFPVQLLRIGAIGRCPTPADVAVALQPGQTTSDEQMRQIYGTFHPWLASTSNPLPMGSLADNANRNGALVSVQFQL